jgi:2-keto-4-pentenoate hydratase
MSLDPRIERGTRAMLALRRARLDAGERPIGWKVGFGAPASLDLLGTDRPLVGFLTDRGLLDDGATVAIGDWTTPMLEPEIAVHIADDAGSIGGLSAAIELADVDVPPDDVERILAGGIYHRHSVLGPPVVDSIAAFRARVSCDGELVAETTDPTALTGDLDFVLESVRLHAGRELADGEIVIAGSVVPPVPVAPGQQWRVELLPLGALELTIAPV